MTHKHRAPGDALNDTALADAPLRNTVSATNAYVGQARERLEDIALLTGRGAFADDIGAKPATLHAAVLRSPHPHARLLAVDAEAALRLPGVRCVLTGDDVQRWSQPFVVGLKMKPGQAMEHWALAVGRVRYAGEPVAVVVAEDRYLAEDALDAIRVEYEELPAVVGFEAALDAQSPPLHEAVGSNVVSDREFCYGDPEAAFQTAARRVAVTVRYPRNSCTPIECGVVIAEHLPGDAGYDVTSNFMGPFSLHAVMAMALKVPANKLRHHLPRDSGGSFGVKQAVFPYVVMMSLAARKAGAPVKWVEDRLEHLSALTSATARLTTIEAAVDGDGRIAALRYDQVEEVGAYLRAPEPATLYRMHGALTGAYAIPQLAVRNRIVLSNKTPSGLVRGFGGPQVYFALERLMDCIAVELQIDPIELRKRNYVRPDQFPYSAAAGAVLDSGDYHRLTELALQTAERERLRERQSRARAAGKLYGIGCAAIVEPSISNMGYISTVLTPEQRAKSGPKNGAIASATVAIDLQGGVNVAIESSPAGQGHMTVCAQVVADVFGIAPEQVVVLVDFDTAKDAWSVAAGNYSSRFAGAVAGTVHLAATRLRDKLARIAAAQLGASADEICFAGGDIFSAVNPERRQPFTRLAASPHWAPGLLPEGMDPGLRETAFWTAPTLTAPDAGDRVNTSAAYGLVFDICGLEVDPDTGAVRVDRYITAHDAGRILNPALLEGQIRGGFAQGVGAALLEELRYGADGSFLSGTLADYLMPTACEVPDPVIVHLETPSPYTPLGAKGVGEGNNMSTPVAIGNAFADALRPLGGRQAARAADVRLPLTPSYVLSLLEPSDPPARGNVAPPSEAASLSTHSTASAARAGGLALQATGTIDIAATPEQVFAVLLDPAALAKVIPGCHALEAEGPLRYRADVTLGVGLVKARYEAQIALSEVDRPKGLRLAGSGTSSLGTGAGDGLVRLEATAGGTKLSYDYRAQVGGKVAMVGSRMLEGAARIIVAQLFEALGRQAAAAQGAAGQHAAGDVKADTSDAPVTTSASSAEAPTLWQRLLRRFGLRR